MTVLSKPGSIGLSIAGETDDFKIIANVIMMADGLLGGNTDGEDIIIDGLKTFEIPPTQENIDKVKAFFPEREWKAVGSDKKWDSTLRKFV